MLTRLSQSVDMEGPVYADLMQMDRYLLNGCELRLKFHQSSNPFRLITKLKNLIIRSYYKMLSLKPVW